MSCNQSNIKLLRYKEVVTLQQPKSPEVCVPAAQDPRTFGVIPPFHILLGAVNVRKVGIPFVVQVYYCNTALECRVPFTSRVFANLQWKGLAGMCLGNVREPSAV